MPKMQMDDRQTAFQLCIIDYEVLYTLLSYVWAHDLQPAIPAEEASVLRSVLHISCYQKAVAVYLISFSFFVYAFVV